MNEFDLDGAIAQWRERLSWREAFTKADLDEMEGHLREEVGALSKSGMSEQKAFFEAVREFGEDVKLSWRFNQANWERVMVKRTVYAPIFVGNYFKVAVRNLLKNKVYSLINIAGLAIGIACSVLIFLFVQNELSYDRFHEKADRIYRIALEWNFANGDPTVYYAVTVKPLAEKLRQDYPVIEKAVRVNRAEPYFRRGDVGFYEERTFFVDQPFFEVFSFGLLRGNPETALKDPFSVVLTEETARKYFGDEDPIGQTIIGDFSGDKTFTVTGIMASMPSNSHFIADVLVSFETYNPDALDWDTGWGTMIAATYVLLVEGADPDDVDVQIAEITQRYQPGKEDEFGIRFRHFLQPLPQIHLHSHMVGEIGENSKVVYVYMFAIIGVFILIIACINFVNLTTARSVRRAREVGLRKVVGAHRRQLIYQFLGEAIFTTLIAFIMALLLIEIALPFFNNLADKELMIGIVADGATFLMLTGIILAVGVIAGSYPAFLLSNFKPIQVLKGVIESSLGGARIRKGLVIFQFAISIVLIVGTVVVHAQLNFMQNKKLGFDQTQLLVLNLHYNPDPKILGQYKTMKSELLRLSQVQHASYSWSLPGRRHDTAMTDMGDKETDESRTFRPQYVDYDFLKTYDIKIVAGRAFSKELLSESSEVFMLNETAVKQLGWGTYEEAIKRELNPDRHGNERRLIGVVQDFHYQGLQTPIEPMFIRIREQYKFLAIKVQTERVLQTIDAIRTVWDAHLPNRPFEHFFLDEDFNRQYQNEIRVGQIFNVFSLLAVFIASLGILGLISFTAQQRTKEIGIRKVLGASVSNILVLLTRDFVKLILLANLIAWPVAYYAMNRWLEDFAYRMTLSIDIFVWSGLAALLIALLTVGYQAMKAAQANPVDTLHYE